jgi:hypothetical protein
MDGAKYEEWQRFVANSLKDDHTIAKLAGVLVAQNIEDLHLGIHESRANHDNTAFIIIPGSPAAKQLEGVSRDGLIPRQTNLDRGGANSGHRPTDYHLQRLSH